VFSRPAASRIVQKIGLFSVGQGWPFQLIPRNLEPLGANLGANFLCRAAVPNCQLIATGKKDGDREAELEAAIEKIKAETWKTGQTLPKLRHAIALILQELKH
jgi:hypothetical protein